MRRITNAVLAVVAASVAASVAACAADTGSSGSNATTTTRTAEPTARGTPSPPVSSTPSTASTSNGTADGAKPVPPAGCSETPEWGTTGKTATPFSIDALYLARVGRHDCYDRLVLDINGPAEVGYSVRYVPVVTADGSGKPIPVAGRAALQVVLHAPPLGLDNAGHQPGRTFADAGDHLYTTGQLTGWRSLRAVRFAGFFEGRSTLAVGVSDKLPFRVFTQLDAASHVRRLVVDVAHDQS